jgi:hypothetical protein
MPRIRTLVLALLATMLSVGAGALNAGSALASHGQSLWFEAPAELLSPATRAETIAQMQHLGVKGVRIELSWNAVSPGSESAQRPNFNASDPSAYNWGAYSSLIEEIHALHWQILLTISPPAPRWATSNGTAPYVTRPDNQDFREFMTAVGRRYGADVTHYGIWNEPNEYNSLRPQFSAGGAPVAGTIYRGLFQAGYAGLRAAGIRSPRVLLGETAPGGFAKQPKAVLGAGVTPLAFLRGALCLNAAYRKAPTCSKLPAYGWAQHPYAPNVKGPFDVPANPEWVVIGTLRRLVTALNRAGKAGAINRGLPIFITEFGVMSKPNHYFGIPVAQQAEYDAISERIAWENPRVASFSQYLLRDDALSPEPNVVTFQTGLESAGGTKKPLYYGFPIPLTVTNARHGYDLWGYVRPSAGKATSVTVLIQHPHSSAYKVLAKLHTSRLGYWTLKSKVRGTHWRVRWTSPAGVVYQGPPVLAYRAP